MIYWLVPAWVVIDLVLLNLAQLALILLYVATRRDREDRKR